MKSGNLGFFGKRPEYLPTLGLPSHKSMMGRSYIDGTCVSSSPQSPPLPRLTPATEGKVQLLCVVTLELLFLLHPLDSLALEDQVEQGFSHLGRRHIHLGGLLTHRWWGLPTRVADHLGGA